LLCTTGVYRCIVVMHYRCVQVYCCYALQVCTGVLLLCTTGVRALSTAVRCAGRSHVTALVDSGTGTFDQCGRFAAVGPAGRRY